MLTIISVVVIIFMGFLFLDSYLKGVKDVSKFLNSKNKKLVKVNMTLTVNEGRTKINLEELGDDIKDGIPKNIEALNFVSSLAFVNNETANATSKPVSAVIIGYNTRDDELLTIAGGYQLRQYSIPGYLRWDNITMRMVIPFGVDTLVDLKIRKKVV